MQRMPIFLLLALPWAVAFGDKDDTGTVPPPSDADGDGFTEDIHCDDGDAAIHPGADECCDGMERPGAANDACF
jgi:hypothetical protein